MRGAAISAVAAGLFTVEDSRLRYSIGIKAKFAVSVRQSARLTHTHGKDDAAGEQKNRGAIRPGLCVLRPTAQTVRGRRRTRSGCTSRASLRARGASPKDGVRLYAALDAAAVPLPGSCLPKPRASAEFLPQRRMRADRLACFPFYFNGDWIQPFFSHKPYASSRRGVKTSFARRNLPRQLPHDGPLISLRRAR